MLLLSDTKRLSFISNYFYSSFSYVNDVKLYATLILEDKLTYGTSTGKKLPLSQYSRASINRNGRNQTSVGESKILDKREYLKMLENH